MCKPYNCAPYSAGVHEATDSTAVTMCGQETKSLSHELEGDNVRQVGVRHSGRVSNPLHQPTSPRTLAKPSYVLRRAKLIAAERGEHSIREGCHHPGAEPSSSGEFLFNPVPCSQERRSDETSHQPQKVERVGGTPALQDGRYGDTQGTVEGERLDGEGRSERRLLHHSNTCRASTISKVQGETTTLPVHLPTIRPVMCPMGVHQGDEAPCHPPTEYGSTYDSVYRRHAADGRVHQSGRGTSGSPDILADRSGLCHQYTQVDHNPNSADRVSGYAGGLHLPPIVLTRRETPPHQDGDQSDPTEVPGDSTSTGSINWEAACNFTCSPSCSSVLPVPTGGPSESTGPQQSGLRHIAVHIASSPGGAQMVAGEALPIQRQTSDSQNSNCDHQIRCISPGMGSGMQWHQDRRTLEPLRAGNAHKLPRITGGNPGNQNLPEGSSRSISVVTAGQSDSCSIHQQHGGDSLSPSNGFSQSTMDVGFVQGYCSECGTHSRGFERCGRCRVQVHERQDRLETSSQAVQGNRSAVGPPGGRLVCISAIQSTSTLFQLETGSSGGSNRCIQPTVATIQRVCKPSMVSDRQSSLSSEGPTGSGDPGGPSMEGPTLVSSPTGNALQLSSAASSTAEPVPANLQCRSDGPSTPTSRLACLRQKFGSGNLSEAAKELLLKSWRTKTSRAYDSHFRKWLGWCAERNVDPISGPISDVANFLADLHGKGYQTSSLNAYRSAISSVHDKVDDMDVGKHPLVCRVLKGAFHARPPLPRYSATWDVQVVLDCILQWGDTGSLSLKLLTFKLVMLMSLARPSRSADLASFSMKNCRYNPEGVTFLPSSLAKQSRQGKPLTDYFFASFPDNKQLCPVETLRQYQSVTAPLRSDSDQLLIAIIKPHKPVASCTIAHWLKEVLKMAGVDINIFMAHSTRSASSSAAADSA